ncbi:leucine-rich repeat domain-containing protein [Marinicella meishanensis]|uniref:leucine-rich repeat domain-containing protein n=1 Tax=Marinicella meishanensis TaxID=2873263 RepID=UPI001CBEA616|nr:leucine-rich repeat domain-containing protein [Marinicella sp. NBU2979]
MQTIFYWRVFLSGLFLCGGAMAQLNETTVCTQSGLGVPVIECEALVAFYNAGQGDGWSNNQNWGVPPVDDWAGISAMNGHVRIIDFSTIDGYSGPLPSELGDLTELESFVFGFKAFEITGIFPSELGQLTQLMFFDVVGSQLVGPIPNSAGQWSDLTYLRFTGNDFLNGPIPDSLGNLSNLEYMDLSNNALEGEIPGTLGQLANLEYLNLSTNRLTGTLPDEFINLTALDELIIRENYLAADEEGNALIPASLQSWFDGLSLTLTGQQQNDVIFSNGFEAINGGIP